MAEEKPCMRLSNVMKPTLFTIALSFAEIHVKTLITRDFTKMCTSGRGYGTLCMVVSSIPTSLGFSLRPSRSLFRGAIFRRNRTEWSFGLLLAVI